jgi:phosphatidylglycerol---prolipoprotein diacylglyceryl transferase
VHPELARLHLFGFERIIYWYGVLMIAGVAIGIAVGVARAPRFSLARFDVLAVGLLGLVGGLVGGVVVYDVVQWRAIVADPRLLLRPGLVFYGGFLGGAAAAWAYCRAWGVSLARVADAGAPGLALGHAIGRIGCLLGGCCYGRPVAPDFPLAVQLAGTTRHPTQLYEAAGLVVIAVGTALLPAAVIRRPGATFLVYLGAYALLRFFVEPFRGDDAERGFFVTHWLSTSQAIALAMLAVSAVLLYRLSRKGGP